VTTDEPIRTPESRDLIEMIESRLANCAATLLDRPFVKLQRQKLAAAREALVRQLAMPPKTSKILCSRDRRAVR